MLVAVPVLPATPDADRYDGLSNRVELDISGMTCAACAARIEKRLNKLDGVRATVNYATERAIVLGLPPDKAPDAVAVVEAAGYGASEVVDGEESRARGPRQDALEAPAGRPPC